MGILFNILMGTVVLALTLFLPKLYRQKQAERLHRVQHQAEVAAMPSQRRALYDAFLRQNNHFALIATLLLGSAPLIYLYVFSWLDDLSALLITTRAQQLRIFHYSLIECALLGLIGIIWLQFKARTPITPIGRLKALGNQILGLLPIVFFTWALLNSATAIILAHTASSTPTTIAGTIVRAGTRHSGRATTTYFADVRPTDGSPILRVSSFRSIHSWLTGYTIRVNDQCPIQTLPEGLPVLLHGRTSNFGFALDEITSDTPCSAHIF